MGKSAKLRCLARLCKERGLPKPYKGKGRYAKETLSSYMIDRLIEKVQIRPGDVAHDCDGFNHIVKDFFSPGLERWHTSKKSRILNLDQFEFEDGRLSCGCQASPSPPETREDIEAYMLKYCIWARDGNKGWFTETCQRYLEALEAGKHICDKRGVLLEEYR